MYLCKILKFKIFKFIMVMVVVARCGAGMHRKPHHKDYSDKTLWKKEYEEELQDAMFAPKKENITRVPQSAQSDSDSVVDRLMDSITTSEKYLKKVDSIDFRLNRLDIEVHEKTNNILKHLTDITKALHAYRPDKTSTALLDAVKSDIYQIKFLLESSPRAGPDAPEPKDSRTHYPHTLVEGSEYHTDTALDSRLNTIEGQIKNLMIGVDSIVTTIKEVKARQLYKGHGRTEELPSGTPGAGRSEAMNLINEFRRSLQEQKYKKCDAIGRVDRSERYPTDCREIQLQGFNVSGIYKIRPDDMEPFYALCDLTVAGGGWTVFQNRYDGSQDFYKGWSDYKHGFGNLAGEFWLGLEKVYYLTNQKLYELRVDMETQHGAEAYAAYSVFTIGPEYEGFRISTLGTYFGTAGDSLSYHAGQKFSTYDADNDEWKDGACAIEHGGAWWYKECDKSNLNGKYATSTAEDSRGQSLYWISYKGPNYPLAKTKMMIRPLPASRPSSIGDQSRKIVPLKDRDGLVKRPPGYASDSGSDVYLKSNLYRYEDDQEAYNFALA